MTIQAKVIADSIGPKSRRLTTLEVEMPRFILAQFNTHRQFSRNAASSRAIPLKHRIASILEDPVIPVRWGKNKPGMQAEEEIDQTVQVPFEGTAYHLSAEEAWIAARNMAIQYAQHLDKIGVHKEIVNRVLEPYAFVKAVVTSTQYDNFFSLRRHPDAQPEIKALADAMYDAMQDSTPRPLQPGQWHLPYVTDEEQAYASSSENIQHDPIPLSFTDLIKASVARCARVSYLTHDGQKPAMEADLALYDRLVGMVPLHASPAEHQATPDELIWNEADLADWKNPHLHGNLQGGWVQYRKTLPGECYDEWENPLKNTL